MEQIYRAGLKKLKSTLGDHLDAYEFFYKAQNLGHEEAKAKFAFALLFGLKYNQNIPRAYEIFQELSLKGNSDAHLVFIILNYQFKIFILYYDMFLLFLGYGFLVRCWITCSCESAKSSRALCNGCSWW